MTAIPFGYMAYSLVVERTRLVNEAIRDSTTHADQVTKLISQTTANTELLLNMLSRLPIVQAGEDKPVNSFLLDMVSQYPQYSSIFIVDSSGQRWATTNQMTAPASYSDRKYFVNALSTGKFSSGEYAIGKIKQKPVFSFGLPVRNSSGSISGVAVATIELSGLKSLVLRGEFRDSNSVIILDHVGKILLHSINSSLEGTQKESSIFQRLQQGPEEGTVETEGEQGTSKKIVVYKKLSLPGEKSPYMYVLVEADKSLLLQTPIRSFYLSLSFLLFSMILSLAVAFMVSKHFMLDRIDESEQRHRDLFETSPHGIIYQNTAGVTVSANPFAERILYGLNTPLGDTMPSAEYPKFIHEDETSYPVETHPGMEALTSGVAVHDRIMGILRSSEGDCTWLKINSIPMFHKDEKKPYMVYSMFEDITKQREQQQEQQAMERKIHQARKLESLGVMAGGIAHDFNNLLQSIQGNMELALREITPNSKQYEYITNSMISCKHAVNLTNLMLTYVGNEFVIKKELNLNELVMENVKMLKATALSSVSTELLLSSEPPLIMADEAGIQQVVMNLVINAAEAIDEQTGLIRLTSGVRKFDQTFLDTSILDKKTEAGLYAFLEVSDNGCGMNQETISRLMDPFFTTKFTGRGLGMSAVMGIIKTHGGDLFVVSEPGKGTTITILLPAPKDVPSDSTHAASPALPLKPPLSKKQFSGLVLVVDDEKSVLSICSKMLKLSGFETITARDGAEAIEKFRAHADKIVVVIMDLTMPKLDGVSAVRKIHEIKPETKVILASGFNKEELGDCLQDLAPCGFIRKPYTLVQLQGALASVV
jgi:PAS domain S-box-containing protein